jgi:hypothetical protein
MSIETILPLLNGVKNTGPGRWLAKCPIHDDHSPSLALTLTDSGKVLIHCFGCQCGIDEFCTALGISLDEVFPEKLFVDYSGKRKREYFNARDVLKSLSKEITVAQLIVSDIKNGVALPDDAIKRLDLAHDRIVQGQYYAGL